jgi:cell division protein FtsB
MNAPETSQWVVVSGVVATVLASFVLISERVRLILAPIGVWWSTRAERRALRQAEAEASVLIRNDQRVAALTDQVAFLVEELAKSREESAALRAEIVLLHGETARLNGEVASLRAELARYRAGGGVDDDTERVSES